VGEWVARIVRTEGVIDENTRLSYAVASIKDPYQRNSDGETAVILPMGTFVDGVIDGKSASGLIQLPRSALRGGDTVFIANDRNELEIRAVDVVRATTEEVYVANSIYPGDRVIITGITAPIPGSKLRIRGEPTESVVSDQAESASEDPSS